jgi:hypothetical protein
MTFFYSQRRSSTFKFRCESKYCHRLGHTIFQCWKLHGRPRPSNRKNKGGGESHAFQAINILLKDNPPPQFSFLSQRNN